MSRDRLRVRLCALMVNLMLGDSVRHVPQEHSVLQELLRAQIVPRIRFLLLEPAHARPALMGKVLHR